MKHLLSVLLFAVVCRGAEPAVTPAVSLSVGRERGPDGRTAYTVACRMQERDSKTACPKLTVLEGEWATCSVASVREVLMLEGAKPAGVVAGQAIEDGVVLAVRCLPDKDGGPGKVRLDVRWYVVREGRLVAKVERDAVAWNLGGFALLKSAAE